MVENNTQFQSQDSQKLNEDEISLNELVLIIKRNIYYLKTKWMIICLVSLLGGSIFYIYAHFQKSVYTASLSFVLEEENVQSSGGGLSGIASQFGFDLGGTSNGAFSQANIMELMKSRELIELTLLTPVTLNGRRQTLADIYIDSMGLKKNILKDKELSDFSFLGNHDQDSLTFKQRSLLISIYKNILTNLSVSQKDKKASILVIEYKNNNETFAKIFTEKLASKVSEFYIQTKSAKAKNNVDILQKQADSLRLCLNAAISGVAIVNENTFNLNPALSLMKVPSTKHQVDVQTNSTLLAQILGSLEMAKISLRKETPLFFIIDRPVFPLTRKKPSGISYFILGGMLFGAFSAFIILIKKYLSKNKV